MLKQRHDSMTRKKENIKKNKRGKISSCRAIINLGEGQTACSVKQGYFIRWLTRIRCASVTCICLDLKQKNLEEICNMCFKCHARHVF